MGLRALHEDDIGQFITDIASQVNPHIRCVSPTWNAYTLPIGEAT